MSLPSARPIAFNRRLRFVWLHEAIRLRASGIEGDEWSDAIKEMISIETPGKDSIAKSFRYINAMWGGSKNEDTFRTEALAIYNAQPSKETARILSWGMAIVTYPFLNEVATTVGRLLRIQEEVKLEQILRKLTETHGEKETVRRSGRYSLGLTVDLQLVAKGAKAGFYRSIEPSIISTPELSVWLAKAWFKTMQCESMSISAFNNHPSLAAFDGNKMLADALATEDFTSERLSMSEETLKWGR